jgi:hypothetical protein
MLNREATLWMLEEFHKVVENNHKDGAGNDEKRSA